MSNHLLKLVLVSATALALSVVLADSPEGEYHWPMEIPRDELWQITTSLIERFPELASSPGVKAAYLSEDDGTRSGTVYFYPHKESGGIKEAYRATCEWDGPDRSWRCDYVVPRRYLQLSTQDYEVRLRRDVSPEIAVPLIHASQRDLRILMAGKTEIPDTVFWVRPDMDDGFRVSLGTADGQGSVTMLAKLRAGGDVTNPNDWQATILATAADWESDWLIGPPWGRAPGLIEIVPWYKGAKFGGYRIGPGIAEERFTSLGLETGDLLTKVGGVAVSNHVIPVARRFESLKVGETINITIERGPDHREMELELKLKQQ